VTLGGGRIVDAQPGRRHRRFRPEVMQRLEALAAGTPEDILLQTLTRQGVVAAREAVKGSGLPRELAEGALAKLIAQGDAVYLGEPVEPTRLGVVGTGVVARAAWERLTNELTAALADYHGRYPLRVGMAREEVGSRLKLANAFLGPFLERAAALGLVVQSGLAVCLPDHSVRLSETQQAAADRVLAAYRGNRTPPALAQAEADLGGSDVLQVLLGQGQLIKASEDVLFDPATWAAMRDELVAHLRAQGEVTVASVRDLLGTSRKYALAFLEDTDRQRITKRVGDVRVLR
jgi:selenocysteine-specific elongation factor